MLECGLYHTVLYYVLTIGFNSLESGGESGFNPDSPCAMIHVVKSKLSFSRSGPLYVHKEDEFTTRLCGNSTNWFPVSQ